MNKNTAKKVLVVSNSVFDNTTDLDLLLNKMKNELQSLPQYIDYVTYIGTDFLEFITKKYSKGYRIIIGGFYSSQCLSVFDFLNNHNDLLLISSASTAIFPKKMPTNLIRLPSNDEMAFSLFKNKVLDSMNQVLLILDPTLLNFSRQKEIINLNTPTFVKMVNVLYTDEDLYNLSYVRMIKRSITGKEPYTFKFYKIDSATIAQNKLTPEASAILKTTDASNVFMILTISYAQQFLNILSSNFEYGIQMIFFSDSFTSYNFTVKSQLPYAYTLINEIEPSNIDYYQRILFNDYAGYINYYTVSILQFLKSHSELMNNNILNNLSTPNMIKILVECNEFAQGQPLRDKSTMITITYIQQSSSTLSQKKPVSSKKRRKGNRGSLSSSVAALAAAAAAASTRNASDIPSTSTLSGSLTSDTKKSLNILVNSTILDKFKSYISGLKYINNNPSIFPTNNISELLNFLGNKKVNTFINTKYTCNILNTYLWTFYYQLSQYDSNTSAQNDENIVTTMNTLKKKIFFNNFKKLLSKIIQQLNF